MFAQTPAHMMGQGPPNPNCASQYAPSFAPSGNSPTHSGSLCSQQLSPTYSMMHPNMPHMYGQQQFGYPMHHPAMHGQPTPAGYPGIYHFGPYNGGAIMQQQVYQSAMPPAYAKNNYINNASMHGLSPLQVASQGGSFRRGSTSSFSTAGNSAKEGSDYTPIEPVTKKTRDSAPDSPYASSSVDDIGEVGPKKFPCTYTGCDEVFDWKVRRDAHMREHVTEEARKFKCSYCKKGFLTLGCLKSHTRIHTRKADSYVCTAPSCAKRYSTAEGLRLHVRNHHVVDKKWVCKVAGCSRSFVRHADLRLHNIRIHSKDRPYPCNVEGCKKAFACFSELKRHLACHNKHKKVTNKPRSASKSTKNNSSTPILPRKVDKATTGLEIQAETSSKEASPVTSTNFSSVSVASDGSKKKEEEFIAAQALANLTG